MDNSTFFDQHALIIRGEFEIIQHSLDSVPCSICTYLQNCKPILGSRWLFILRSSSFTIVGKFSSISETNWKYVFHGIINIWLGLLSVFSQLFQKCKDCTSFFMTVHTFSKSCLWNLSFTIFWLIAVFGIPFFPVSGLSINILHAGNKSPTQRGSLKISVVDLLPALRFLVV